MHFGGGVKTTFRVSCFIGYVWTWVLILGAPIDRSMAEDVSTSIELAVPAGEAAERPCCSPQLGHCLPRPQAGRGAISPDKAGMTNPAGLAWVFDTSPYPPRWHCGDWSPAIGWLHICSDVAIWSAYVAIPIALIFFTRKKSSLPFKGLLLLFSAFIISCGFSHLLEAAVFWWPAYGLLGVIKFVTAIVSIVTVGALAIVIPEALNFRSPAQLEEEVRMRTHELDLAKQQAMMIIEASPAGMVMIDREGKIVMVNAMVERMFGYDRAEMINQTVEMLLPERFRAAHPGQREAFFASPKVREMGAGRDLYGRRSDGQEFPLEIGLNPVQSEGGLFVLSAIVDISERQKMERKIEEHTEELATLNDALLKSNQDLQQFASVASHDLQEPLRKISSYCQLLREECGENISEDALHYINVAIDGAERSKVLINDLLSFSRITTRGKPLGPTDAGDCAQAALANLEMAIEETSAQVTVEPLPVVIADRSQLVLMFQNLINNALKYRGEAAPQVHIGGRETEDCYEFFVKDNGIGIEPQYYERIFEIFQRLHNRRQYSGTGIGLALCKRIIERFGREIWVDSTPGAGSTFFFTLNKAPESGPLDGSVNESDSVTGSG